MAELNVASVPWVDSGDAPPLPLDRDKRDIISQGVADPLYDYDIVPLTYVNSRWFAFFYRADESDLKTVLPKCLDLEDDVVEFWYVDHNHTGVGPYGEVGVTIAASCKSQDGNTYYGGYYPYMWLTASPGVAARAHVLMALAEAVRIDSGLSWNRCCPAVSGRPRAVASSGVIAEGR